MLKIPSFLLLAILCTFQYLYAETDSKINQEVYFLKQTKVYKQWKYEVSPILGICQIDSGMWWHIDENTPEDKKNQIVQSILDKTLFDKNIAMTFAYIPSSETFSVGITTKLFDLDEGAYQAIFEFDNKESVTQIGYIAKHVAPETNLTGVNYRNILVFGHKEILRDIVPLMKKYNYLIIKLGKLRLKEISLSGFSKSYATMQACMGDAVNFDLKDPF